MKTFLILGLFIAAMTTSVSAQSFTAPARTQQAAPKKTPPPPISRRDVTGVIPRAIRGGNPLQMLNPRAPARYGTAEESVLMEGYVPDGTRRTSVSDPGYPGKWRGIKFFTFLF
jgi:hypothetical protein